MRVLFFKPVPRKALWGKTLVKDYFNFIDFPFGVGQSWAFSGQDIDSTICITRPYYGKTLNYLWKHNKELFNSKDNKFPLIISLVGSEDDLSIQVHPDDEYAKIKGYESGKNEAWYFIDTKNNSSIIYGHNATDVKDLNRYIDENKWDELIKIRKVKPGDFVYLPAGILHALKKGNIVYEVQQSTDITYRFYDYHRKDDKGNEREIHLKDAIGCLKYGNIDVDIKPEVTKKIDYTKTQFINNDSFTIVKYDIKKSLTFKDSIYQLTPVIEGNGYVDNISISKGESFLIPSNTEVIIRGNLSLMMTTKRS